MRELFRDGYAAKDAPSRREFAKKLLKSAERETSDKVLLYVLLQEAGDMAARAGDAEIALEAAGRLGRSFEVDGTGLKIERLKGLARGIQGLEAQGAFVRAYDGLVLEAILERGPKDASQLTASAATVAEKSSCALLQEKVRFWKELLDECREEVSAVVTHYARLAKSREDYTANLAVGRFHCLVLEDWEKGLPMLLQSHDPTMGPLAESDLRNPSDPAERRKLATAWIGRSKGEKGRGARSMALRGYRWRVKALDGLEGIEREQLELALAEMPLRYLAEMEEFDVSVGWGSFKKDGSLHTEGPIEVHGFRSPYGIFLHPPDNGASRAKYRLGGRWDTFQAIVALSDKGKPFRGSLSFSVHGDGKLLWSSSPVTQPGRAQKCKLSVARIEVLELRVDCRGPNAFALGAWIDPFVTRK